MGRAFEVRKAAMAKTSAAKAKLYSRFGKEIYLAAKNGGADINANLTLRRVIDTAKRQQVPSDIINRAMEKARGQSGENYQNFIYEIFGPGSSQLIVECLSDNVNRTLSDIRAAMNKTKAKMGAQGSLLHQFSKYSIYTLPSGREEELIEAFLENDINLIKYEEDSESLTFYSDSNDHQKIASLLENKFAELAIIDEAVMYLSNDEVELNEEDKELFARLLELLNISDDVQNVYHNVK